MLSRGERGGYADREVDAFLIKERDDKPSRTQGRHIIGRQLGQPPVALSPIDG